ncbi:MAG: SWIM zinc finger family protein, partial [Cetobacterium sp.]
MDFLKSLERKAGTVIYYRGDSIYRSNKIKNLKVYNSSTDVDKNIFAFSAEITGSRGENYKTILYTDTKKIIHSICSCPYFTENNKICKHIVALGLKAHYGMIEGDIKPPEPIKIFEVEKNVVEKKNKIIEVQDNSKLLKIFERYEIKLQNIIKLNATLQMKYSDIHRKKPIGLSLNLEVESKDKKYKLNSKLDKFLECYEKEKLIFGKAYTYNPDTDYLEGNSKELMNLLMGYYNTLNDSYYYSNFNIETFMKNGYMFDRLVDVLSLSGSILLEKVELKDILNANISQNMNDKLEIDFTDIKNLMKYGNSTLLNLSAFQELDKKIFYRLSSGDMKLYEKILKEKKRKEKIILDLEHLSFAINS